MSGLLDKLNLRPGERRLVVIVAIVVFVVLNIWIVWPRFGDLGRSQQRTRDAQTTLNTYQNEVNKKADYEKELKKLEGLGLLVASEEQALQLQKEVQSQAALSGVIVQTYNPSQRGQQRTNAYFEEQTLIITVNTGEKELIDFLYNLGARSSLIRVRSMTLGPDSSRMRLAGSVTLVESFQRKTPFKSPTPTAPAIARVAPAAKVTNPVVKAASPPPKIAPQPPKTSGPPVKATNVPIRISPPPKRS